MPQFLLAFGTQTVTISNLPNQILTIAVGVALFSAGVVALAVFFFRRKTSDLTLVYFSLFSLLYAGRMLMDLSLVRSALAMTDPLHLHARAWVTYILPIPFLLFLLDTAQDRGRTFLRGLLMVQPVFAVVAIIGDVLGRGQALAANINRLFTFALVAGLVVNIPWLRPKASRKPLTREFRILLGGLIVFGAFVLHGNLADMHLVPGSDIEPIGLLVLVGCLGYVAAYRTFANEERLLAINKELEIARQIQSSTLPREIPKLAGLEIAARYVPMSAVAGDFYDFLVVDDQRIGILVADVTGHGVPAALIASMLKVAFAGQSAHADDPARLLAGLNRALCGKFEDHFVTAAYVFIDMNARVLRYAGAGHPPLMLASRSNGVRLIEENGLMLGLFPEADYTATEIPLRSGDRCLLYTDGILEAMDSSQQEFGKARLQQSLEAHRDLSAVQFTSALLDEISRWSGHATGRRQEDDITLVALDFSEEPG